MSRREKVGLYSVLRILFISTSVSPGEQANSAVAIHSNATFAFAFSTRISSASFAPHSTMAIASLWLMTVV